MHPFQENLMSAYPQFLAATPRVTRLEMADLYVGKSTTVVHLDATPCEAWVRSLHALVDLSPDLAGARVEVEGSWIHFIGIRKARTPIAAQILELIATAGEMAYAPDIIRPAASSARTAPAMQ